MEMRIIGWAAALLLAMAPAAWAQSVAVTGPDGQTASLGAADLAAMPHVTLTVKQHDQTHVFEGPALGAILARVGAAQGAGLKGAELATVVRVSAADGYQVALSLADTDPAVRADRIILADREDGAALKADGPFRLVVEGDLKPARAARNVVRIEVLRLATAK